MSGEWELGIGAPHIEADLDRCISLPCDLRKIAEGVAFVRETAEHVLAPTGLTGRLAIAAEEAIANAIDHGSACKTEMYVEVRCLVKDRIFWLVVKDYGGKSFSPDYFLRIATKKIWGKGGRGILMITQIMDTCSYIFRSGKSTTVYLSKSLAPDPDDEDD